MPDGEVTKSLRKRDKEEGGRKGIGEERGGEAIGEVRKEGGKEGRGRR